MKTIHSLTTLVLLWLTTIAGQAALTIPGANGSDGALIITVSTNIDLGLAVPGPWDANNTGSNAGKGVYDADKWAVVFKYSSVNIVSGVTVTFKNHPSRAPVVWLVSDTVVVDGTLNLNGGPAPANSGANYLTVAEPGPGGFRGGARDHAPYNWDPGSGFGPGGYHFAHGGYSTYHPYGNPQIVPLIGGSGGSGGYNSDGGVAGSGGGGAILIAAASSITVNGICAANGGPGWWLGSGGAIRLLADQILGNGKVEAISGAYPGRVRLEANFVSPNLVPNPPTVAASPTPVVIWPDPDGPRVRVVSIGGTAAPVNPTAPITGPASDVTISTTNVVSILLETANFPTSGLVNVYIKPRNASQSILPASFVSGNFALATWQVTTNLLPAYSVIQARAVSN